MNILAAAGGGDAGEEMEEKQQLEDQLRAYTDRKRYKKRQMRELHEDLQVTQSYRQHIGFYFLVFSSAFL